MPKEPRTKAVIQALSMRDEILARAARGVTVLEMIRVLDELVPSRIQKRLDTMVREGELAQDGVMYLKPEAL